MIKIMWPARVEIVAGGLLALALWKGVCVYMRKRRARLMASLHLERDAHAIVACTLFVEFPFLLQRAFEFGLLRSAGIPAISRTVIKAGQLVGNASKRYDDTDILIREMMVHHIDSPRGSVAVRRLNMLHSPYRIRNEHYLYVLAVVALSPIEWTAAYGYREWTQMEKLAYYQVWHNIGTRMGIDNIPTSISELARYRDEYEAINMVYADSNHEVAEISLQLLESKVPTLLRPLARKLALSLIEDKLLTSLGYPKQPPWLFSFTHSLLKLSGLIIRWMPPRPFAWGLTRILSDTHGCPIFNHEATLPLAFHFYKPFSYENGYKIGELGGLKPGELANSFGGELLLKA